MKEWERYNREDLDYSGFRRGSRVLDVGCGDGEQMRALAQAGCVAVGVEPGEAAVRTLRSSGLEVHQGIAEHLPVDAASFDGLVCKVVLPYTDERRAIREWTRVLKPGGRVRASYHGSGYYLRYLLAGENFKLRLYGARSLVNTWVFAVTGRRLPGFVGDTIYQSRARLRRYYAELGFVLEEEWVSPRFAGGPVFIYHVLRLGS